MCAKLSALCACTPGTKCVDGMLVYSQALLWMSASALEVQRIGFDYVWVKHSLRLQL